MIIGRDEPSRKDHSKQHRLFALIADIKVSDIAWMLSPYIGSRSGLYPLCCLPGHIFCNRIFQPSSYHSPNRYWCDIYLEIIPSY